MDKVSWVRFTISVPLKRRSNVVRVCGCNANLGGAYGDSTLAMPLCTEPTLLDDDAQCAGRRAHPSRRPPPNSGGVGQGRQDARRGDVPVCNRVCKREVHLDEEEQLGGAQVPVGEMLPAWLQNRVC